MGLARKMCSTLCSIFGSKFQNHRRKISFHLFLLKIGRGTLEGLIRRCRKFEVKRIISGGVVDLARNNYEIYYEIFGWGFQNYYRKVSFHLFSLKIGRGTLDRWKRRSIKF